ncbi:hypothetical protein BDP81DRAFT_514015 [Colletotrichum phormii]|uniref:NB-ARC domain-containing protein n=1 Tax=Colletotrichum phormii TaxID=359342 RepID=A0AAI9ZUZ2_9PEZI|nr:uncharacterized protein BDP81DRAFT_514015 [Colletotrichum phormii]KAK1638690.1 hypothetical protein BDP81DRAFT_514015 [Colletotrichum phormii]
MILTKSFSYIKMTEDEYSFSSFVTTMLSAGPAATSVASADGYPIQPDVDFGIVQLHRTLEKILSYLFDIKDHWSDESLRGESYGLERAAHLLSGECEKLQPLQYDTYGHYTYGQLAIWEVVRTLVNRCLDEAASPLKGYLHQSINHDEPQPRSGSRFLRLLQQYESMIHSDHTRNYLQNAEFKAYEAAALLKRQTEQFRSQENPDVKKVIEATEKVRKGWRLLSRNVHFTERAPGNNHFVGQREQLEEIRKAFEQPDTPVSTQKRFVLQGLPGSGKSEMALKFATEHRGQFWGVFWIDASSKTNAKASYIEMTKVFGVNSTEQAAKHHLSTRHPYYPWLLIIDNADDDKISLDELAPSGNSGYVLVTTRNPEKIIFGTAGRKYIELSSMQKDDANELLLAAADYKKKNYSQGVLKEVANICHQLHYLPLALVHAGKAIRHHALKMRDYMVYFRKEANIIRERWRQRRLHQDLDPQSGSLESKTFDDNDMSVFASFELLTFSQLNRSNDESFTDAIQLLQIFSFMDPLNIKVEFLVQAALNPFLEVIERRESQKQESEIIQRLGLKSRASWAEVVQRVIQTASNLSVLPPLLPEALKNPQNMNVDDLRGQVEHRVNSALRILVSRSLITRATRDNRQTKDGEIANAGDENEEEDSVVGYYMHPLVHEWIRERPSLSVAQQALFCQYALTVLSNSVRIVGGNDVADTVFRSALKPHIEMALKLSEPIKERMETNLARGETDWWYKRWTRRATQLLSGPWEGQMQMSQNARFGKVFLECGAFEKGEGLLSIVHDYLIQRLGPDHQLANLAKLGLAKALLLQTRRKASTELLRQVYSSRRKTLGEKHPQTLEITAELADSVLALGRISESFDLCKQALAGLEQAYGPHHRKTIHCAHLIGHVHFFYNDFEASVSQHRKVARLVERNANEKLRDGVVSEIETLMYQEHLAGALMTVSRGKPESDREKYLAEADKLSGNVVERRQRIFGQFHPLTLYGRAQRGRILATRSHQDPDKLAEIAKMMLETLKIAQSDLGDSHLGVLAGQKWYAEVLILQGRLNEAENYLRKACDKDKYSDASDIDGEHPDRIWHVWELVQLLQRKGNLTEALELCRELQANIQTVGGHGLGPRHRFNKRLLQRIEMLEAQLGA